MHPRNRAQRITSPSTSTITPPHRAVTRRAVSGRAVSGRAVQRAVVPHLVHMSSVGAYTAVIDQRRVNEQWPTAGIPTSPYSQHKAAAERLLDVAEATTDSALTITRLRPGFVVQGAAASGLLRYGLPGYVPAAALRWVPLASPGPAPSHTQDSRRRDHPRPAPSHRRHHQPGRRTTGDPRRCRRSPGCTAGAGARTGAPRAGRARLADPVTGVGTRVSRLGVLGAAVEHPCPATAGVGTDRGRPGSVAGGHHCCAGKAPARSAPRCGPAQRGICWPGCGAPDRSAIAAAPERTHPLAGVLLLHRTGLVCGLSGYAPVLFHLRLEQVPAPPHQLLAPPTFVVTKRSPVAVVEFLHHLKSPPSSQHVTSDELRGKTLGLLEVPSATQLLHRRTQGEISTTHQLVKRVQVPPSPLEKLHRLRHRAHRRHRTADTPSGRRCSTSGPSEASAMVNPLSYWWKAAPATPRPACLLRGVRARWSRDTGPGARMTQDVKPR